MNINWSSEMLRGMMTNPKKTDSAQTCEVCNKHHKITELHHIVTIKELTNLLNENMIELEEVRTPIVLLCPNCHAYIHKLMSKHESVFDTINALSEDGYSDEQINKLINILKKRDLFFGEIYEKILQTKE